MGNETTYSGVMGGLGRFSAALTANAADLAHLDGARLRLAKLVADIEGVTQQQAAFTASKQEASRQLQKLLVEGQRMASGMTKFRAAPNITTRLQTLGRRSKLYDGAPNFTAPLQALRRATKLYGAAPNFMACLQTLRSRSKLYDVPPNIMEWLQTLR
ncbi:MAG: hypothetical protein WAM82_02040 [Thermoanaerobaculia bacterium]